MTDDKITRSTLILTYNQDQKCFFICKQSGLEGHSSLCINISNELMNEMSKHFNIQ